MLKAAVIVFAGSLVLLWAAYVVWHPKTDEQRWSELLRSARVSELLGRWHLQRLQAGYLRRIDATEKALLASGYLTEVSISVQDSRARMRQIIATITKHAIAASGNRVDTGLAHRPSPDYVPNTRRVSLAQIPSGVSTPNEAMHRMSGTHICLRLEWRWTPLIGDLDLSSKRAHLSFIDRKGLPRCLFVMRRTASI